jgi:hypothetical protein
MRSKKVDLIPSFQKVIMIVHHDDFLKGGENGAIAGGLIATQTNEKIKAFDVSFISDALRGQMNLWSQSSGEQNLFDSIGSYVDQNI